LEKIKATVKIFGVPVAGCKPGKTWQDTANFAKNWLSSRFGEQVKVEYIEFLPPKWKEFPQIIDLINKGKAKIPIIVVNDEVLSTGGKVNISQIERHLLDIGLKKI
jgi:disulfide oxidoreductase YuzD